MTDLDKRIEWLRGRVPIEDVYLEQVRFIMQHYADEYHQSKLKNNEALDLVSQQRELLIRFGFYVTNGNYKNLCSDVRNTVKDFEANI